ncbi:MAG: NACHT domain-containing protein [Candidatus Poribacteria bacterium]|nr:NACHT domain-containing protein [Candidatus Poribacteria bacterium]
MNWQKLKKLIQSIKPADFERLVATLLTSFLKDFFVVARSGDQPSGDARSVSGDVSMQAKRYTGKRSPNAKAVEGDIRDIIRKLPYLDVYVLVVSRDAAQLHDTLDAVSEDTGLDIVTLELSDELSDLGALCVTYWEDICHFFDLSDTNPEFLDWVQIAKNESQTRKKIKDVRKKLEEGIQTQKQIQKDIEKYLLKRFNSAKGFNPINLSQAIGREKESQISDWWETEGAPICCLEGEEGHGKTWLAAKVINSICEQENVVTFWLDSKYWRDAKSISDLLHSCFSLLSYEERKVAKLQNKPAKIWRKTLIVLDGVNERNAIEAAQRILAEYFRNDESEWRDRIRFLLTTRPLDDYPGFERYLWSECHKISVDPFNDSELQEALNQQGLQLDDLPDSLKEEVARIPRYFQRCIELRDELGSFEVVTKEIVLWADLLDKIDRTDPQIKQKFGWHRAKDAQEILADLAKQAKWTNVGPQASVQVLEKYFSDYREVRHDLEEQNIAIEAGLLHAKLSKDHIKLGWALYLANLFDCTEFTDIKDFAEGFQNALEPIPSEYLRTEALFVALQITERSPEPNIPQDQLSQKRAALMIAWFHSHNAQITDERLSFWAKEDPDAYAQVVEFEFEYNNPRNSEDALVAPLAETWLNKKGDLNRLASRLTKWLLPTYTDDTPEEVVYTHIEGQRLPRKKVDIQFRLLDTALSILAQRPERQFLKTLAHCYAILHSDEKFSEDISKRSWFYDDLGKLMRWRYTEEVLGDLYWLAELAQTDAWLLRGVYGLADSLRVDFFPRSERPLTEEDKKRRTFAEQWNRRLKPYIDCLRNQERLLIGDSPAANGNYHGLDYLAVRTDLHDLHPEDHVEIKKILQDVSVNAKLGWSVGATLEDFCIENLLPWVAKHDSKSYAELACSLKLNTLHQQWAQLKLGSIQGLIFQPEDRIKITEAILEMKQRLLQDVQADNSSSDTIYLTSLLTETLLFAASEEVLTDWFEFLALHERLRGVIYYESLPYLLEQLLPKSIAELARQKLEILGTGAADHQSMSNEGSEKFPERDYWRGLYTSGTQTDEELVTWALEELKQRKSDLTAGTFRLMSLVLSDPKRFLDEILNSKEIRKHLFHENSRRSIVPIYEGKDVPSYETLVPLVPLEIVGSFLCSPDRGDDLSRWGRELITRMCSILQGTAEDSNSVEERRFEANREVLRTWAEQDTTNFQQLANEYLTQLSKFPYYSQALSDFTDNIHCLLLRFQPDKAKQYYHQLKTKGLRITYRMHYGVETFFAQLWHVEDCNLPEHRQFRRELLEEGLNDEDIMFMTLAALVEGGRHELWSLVEDEYLESPYAKERNLGVSILPWFGNDEAIEKLKQLKSDDPSQWVRGHAWWAYEVAQQERSCREVYHKALQSRDPFRISAVFEQIKPALSPTARWWCEIEHEEFREVSQNIDPRIAALVDRFWYWWGRSSQAGSNIEVFGRKLREYCRGEKLPAVSLPRIAPWWKPTSD